MIGKPIIGKSFGGCVRYLLNREEAFILEAEGVQMKNSSTITRDFNMQRSMNPRLGKAVGHTVLSWSKEDIPLLDDEKMCSNAKEYMEAMGIINTQFVIVKHTDRQHPHLHIVYNRVNNYGKTISDKNNYERNVKVCRRLTEGYGFYLAKNKEKVNRQQLKGNDKVRYAILDAVKTGLKVCRNWPELERYLQVNGIRILYTYKGESDTIQGISFEKDCVKFKGSAIDRSLSYAGINNIFEPKPQEKTKRYPIIKPLHKNKTIYTNAPEDGKGFSENKTKDLLDILIDPTHETKQNPFEQEIKKRKRKMRFR
ncbi:relaxase/mobilization nuclease domain-containing protein [Sphingobacterium sp.]|uniref:relaxase/mobilization nuclease domain-containing protein n=1 Tax=Sphingobacterium sp. TaxID=341027 RepID=UPI00289EC1A8|nr:relaxase/mobilization nuclease domain-containing protein [Sphingobacterium sp.]